MTCSNCGAQMGCGCQKRTAKDGTKCCQKCVTKYNNQLAEKEKADKKT